MYCIKCGAENADNAKFCNMCGNPMQEVSETKTIHSEQAPVEMGVPRVQQPNYSQTYQAEPSQPTDYRQLGGWLAVFAYGHLVGAVVLAIQCITALIGIVQIGKLVGSLSSYYGASYVAKMIIPSLLLIAITGFGIYCCIKLYNIIKTRSPKVLQFAEIWSAINFVGYVIIAFVDKQYISYILSPLISLTIYELYFRRSVRVSTYFGSDEYLRMSYVTQFMASKNYENAKNATKAAYENVKNAAATINQPTTSNGTYHRNITPEKFCSVCGTGMLMSEMFCPKCGTKKEDVVANEPTVIEKENPSATFSDHHNDAQRNITPEKFCSVCGTGMLMSEVFCPKCGTKKEVTAVQETVLSEPIVVENVEPKKDVLGQTAVEAVETTETEEEKSFCIS